MKSPSPVIVVGPFPPPVGGAAKNTELIARHLEAQGSRVWRLPTSAGALGINRDFMYHYARVRQNIRITIKLCLLSPKKCSIYIVPDGGYGLIYTFCHYVLCLLLYKRIFIHHRTFRYIRKRSLLMRSIVVLGRSSVVHIFLSQGMMDRFISSFGPVKGLVASNAYFITGALEETINNQIATESCRIRLGHLSNLCREKGFFTVVEVFEALINSGKDVELHLAGPVLEDAVAKQLKKLKEQGLPVYHYGYLSGAEKQKFYEKLDVFLFPTHFSQEAQPNVIFEALSAGVPVIATPRACIPEMLVDVCGSVSQTENSYVSFAVKEITRTTFDAHSRENRAKSIRMNLKQTSLIAAEQYKVLLDEIVGKNDRLLS